MSIYLIRYSFSGDEYISLIPDINELRAKYFLDAETIFMLSRPKFKHMIHRLVDKDATEVRICFGRTVVNLFMILLFLSLRFYCDAH
jgi:hypothetical protein